MPDHTNIADKEGAQVALLAGEVPHPIDLRVITMELWSSIHRRAASLMMSHCTSEPRRHSLSSGSQGVQPIHAKLPTAHAPRVWRCVTQHQQQLTTMLCESESRGPHLVVQLLQLQQLELFAEDECPSEL